MATIVLLFGTPFLIGLLVFLGWWLSSRGKQRQADKARETYARLVSEKLDVIRTALAMGQTDEQIRELDARLEKLIGADKLTAVLDAKHTKMPEPTPELLDTDLLAEVERLKRVRQKE